MKLSISIKQLQELNESQLKALVRAFPVPHFQLGAIDPKVLKTKENVVISNDIGSYVFLTDTADFYPLPNIGQMLEFALERDIQIDISFTKNICNDLWEIVNGELK